MDEKKAMTARELAESIVRVLDSKRARDIRLLHMITVCWQPEAPRLRSARCPEKWRRRWRSGGPCLTISRGTEAEPGC